MNNKTTNVRFLAQLGLLAAIEIVMKLIGLGSVPVGPLYMSFLTVPIAVGAMTMGPAAGAILGAVFGLVSFKDALSGLGMTGVFFQISPLNTFVLCVVMRVLMGFCVGLIFKALRLIDRRGGWSYFIGALSAPLLNTLFFMGYIVLVFYPEQGRRPRRGQSADVRGTARRRAGSYRGHRMLRGRRRYHSCGLVLPQYTRTGKGGQDSQNGRLTTASPAGLFRRRRGCVI